VIKKRERSTCLVTVTYPCTGDGGRARLGSRGREPAPPRRSRGRGDRHTRDPIGKGETSSSASLFSSQELIDTTTYEPSTRVLLGNAPHFCDALVLKLGTAPLGTALNLRVLRVIRRGAHAMYTRWAAATPLGGIKGLITHRAAGSEFPKICHFIRRNPYVSTVLPTVGHVDHSYMGCL